MLHLEFMFTNKRTTWLTYAERQLLLFVAVLKGARVLTISEVALLLEGLKTATEQRDPEANLAPLMKKTKDYVDKFRTAKTAAMVQSMRE